MFEEYVPVWAYQLGREFGKNDEQIKADWWSVNNPMGTNYHALHSKWNYCDYFE